MKQKDIRETDLYREIESLYVGVRQPGTGQVSDASDLHVSPEGRHAVFAGTIMDKLKGVPPTRICLTDLTTGDTRVLTYGPNLDRLPRFSPDGRNIAFLSDRHKAGDFQLYLLDPATDGARSAPQVEGWVEYFHWSPDGKQILLGVAGYGAEVSSVQGGVVTNKQVDAEGASWIPSVQSGDNAHRWRRVWLYDLCANQVRQISQPDSNVWEANWCGNRALAAVVSPGPEEGLWFSAHLHIIDVETGRSRAIHRSEDQLALPAASPSGRHLAIVEAVCSDRKSVAGDVRLIETCSGTVRHLDTRGVDVTYTEWRSDQALLLAGHRNFETVVGLYDNTSETFTELWASEELSAGAVYVSVAGLGEAGDCALVGESFTRAPELAVIRAGEYRVVRSFDLGTSDRVRSVLEAAERLTWKAPDGLEIQGWLLRPKGKGPYPLILNIHGGPVGHWRPLWLLRRGVVPLILLQRGYATFYPNPRGSSGRGRDFARKVVGDIGGADTYDNLSGLDLLVQRGIADPKRLGVTGTSYGGYMTSWLITHDTRFAAAVSVAPSTNRVSQRLIGYNPHFVDLFVSDNYNRSGGKYFQRSPIMYAHQAKTPTLNICGALDRCTPPEEAVQFHNALLENGVDSVLVTYPEEGHGIRKFPAAIDYAARVVAWFEEYLRAGIKPAEEQALTSSEAV